MKTSPKSKPKKPTKASPKSDKSDSKKMGQKFEKKTDQKPKKLHSKTGAKKEAPEKKIKRKVSETSSEVPVKKIKKPEGLDALAQPATPLDKKKERQKQKALKAERQKKAKTEDLYALGVEAKKIWEKVRTDKCPMEEKVQLLPQLHALMKGQLSKLVYSHDTVRVVETLITTGDEAVRAMILEELKPELLKMVKTQYAGFLVNKMLKYGTKAQRKQIFQMFESHVAELAKHKFANQTLELYYNDFASTPERQGVLQEFCGPEFRKLKDPGVATVQALLTKHPEKAKFVKQHLHEVVNVLIAKGCYNLGLVHRVIYEYLTVCTPEQRTDLVNQLRDVCVHMVHTEYGKRLTVEAVKYGTTKDRKAIVKSFKGFVVKTCCEDMGYVGILAICDAVDDTKLVGKAILGEMIEAIDELVASGSGRKVLMYLVAARNTTYISKDVIDLLETDTETSKKDPAIRAAELRALISPALVKYVLTNMTELLKDNGKVVFLTCLLNYADGMAPCMSQLAEEAAKPFTSHDDDASLVEAKASHMMLKKLISRDKERYAQDPSQTQNLFSLMLLKAMDEDSWDSFLNCNRGCFLLVNMLETEIEEIREQVQTKMKTFKKTLQKQKTNGAEILRKKL
ncbi:hypothetical protein TCAL_02671 [Tigriopus californicus]|uniref:PUM-HD domain-containing protein n=2 Tax=Tigriopus californicus TaxID=6832 RepID=A0A553PGA3_TIGCA|nr:hypothetical protein TCAL_02671 [Tigriopus californicus]